MNNDKEVEKKLLSSFWQASAISPDTGGGSNELDSTHMFTQKAWQIQRVGWGGGVLCVKSNDPGYLKA